MSTNCMDKSALSEDEKLADELSVAAATGDLNEVVKLCGLARGKELVDAKGWNALHWASQEGCLEIVKHLLACGISVNVETTVERLTPLIQAVGGGHVDVVKCLLESGATPGQRFPFLNNVTSMDIALTYARKYGRKYKNIVELLKADSK